MKEETNNKMIYVVDQTQLIFTGELERDITMII